MKKELLTILVVGIITTVISSCQAAKINHADSTIIEDLDISYDFPVGGNPDASKLDIFYNTDGAPKRLMVFVHGGSWIAGDKSNLRTQAHAMIDWFVARDYVVAAINFRLASQLGAQPIVTYLEQLTDIAHALSWLSQNSSNYGVTENDMVLVGFSSGAHLVPLLTTDQSYLQSVGFDIKQIAGTVSLDVHVYDVPLALGLMQGSVIEQNIPFIEHLFGSTQAQQLNASPVFHAPNASVPASLIVSAEPSASIGSHGYITAQAGQNYVQQLEAFGHQATWVHFDDETHGSLATNFGAIDHGPTQAVAIFLDTLVFDAIFENGFE